MGTYLGGEYEYYLKNAFVFEQLPTYYSTTTPYGTYSPIHLTFLLFK